MAFRNYKFIVNCPGDRIVVSDEKMTEDLPRSWRNTRCQMWTHFFVIATLQGRPGYLDLKLPQVYFNSLQSASVFKIIPRIPISIETCCVQLVVFQNGLLSHPSMASTLGIPKFCRQCERDTRCSGFSIRSQRVQLTII